MNSMCARCNKTVYPVEKLSCLDKTWHKPCFTCETCNLKLTMKSYKGYNKLPYCVTHYPTTKFTAVADTPENKRLAKQTKNQSSLDYHKDHHASLAKFSQVTETPASETSKRNQMNISNVHYHNQPAAREAQEVARQAGTHQHPEEPADYNPAGELETVQSGGYQPPPPQMAAPPAPPAAPKGPKYVAAYDYQAADSDEVSFNEGDTIVEVTVIDDGWMEGTVARTGQHGMLPSNYIEQV